MKTKIKRKKKRPTKLKRLQKLVREQAKDYGLWFITNRAAEEYLQRALRELHRVIEE